MWNSSQGVALNTALSSIGKLQPEKSTAASSSSETSPEGGIPFYSHTELFCAPSAGKP